MGRIEESHTRITLLGRLGRDQSDPAAWSEFVDHYGRKIYGWCRVWGLQDADAQDVTQHVLLKLVNGFRDFQYEPGRSFRAWLKTITHHAWHDYLKARQRPGLGSGDSSILRLVDNVEAREDLSARLQNAFDRELLDEAIARVRSGSSPGPGTRFACWPSTTGPGTGGPAPGHEGRYGVRVPGQGAEDDSRRSRPVEPELSGRPG